jgi:hypothetical protein
VYFSEGARKRFLLFLRQSVTGAEATWSFRKRPFDDMSAHCKLPPAWREGAMFMTICLETHRPDKKSFFPHPEQFVVLLLMGIQGRFFALTPGSFGHWVFPSPHDTDKGHDDT